MSISKAIWVVGNMGAGKSTLCKKLMNLKIFTEYTHLNIDSFRLIHNSPPSIHGNEYSMKLMKESLENSNKVLIESIGTWSPLRLERFRNDHLIIKLVCDKDISLDRIDKRSLTNENPPVPDNFPPVEESWDDFEARFIQRIKSNYTIDTTDLNPDKVLEKCKEILQNHYKLDEIT